MSCSPSQMSKAELMEELRKWGEEPPVKWLQVEHLARLSAEEIEASEKVAVKVVTRLKNRTALRDYLTKNGVAWTQHATNADINAIALAQHDADAQAGGRHDGVMGFGKHAQETYGQVFTNAPDYVKWCVTTSDEEMRQLDSIFFGSEYGGTCEETS